MVFLVYGLLDQVNPCIGQRPQRLNRLTFRPTLVDVYAHTYVLAQRLLDRGNMAKVFCERLETNLQLKDIVPPGVEHLLGFVDVFARVTTGERPGHAELCTKRTAQ